MRIVPKMTVDEDAEQMFERFENTLLSFLSFFLLYYRDTVFCRFVFDVFVFCVLVATFSCLSELSMSRGMSISMSLPPSLSSVFVLLCTV